MQKTFPVTTPVLAIGAPAAIAATAASMPVLSRPVWRHDSSKIRAALLASAALGMSLAVASPATAQDATWLLNPGTSDFNTAANWNPAAVPTGTAFFDASNTTSLTFSRDTFINGFTFNAGAPAFTFTLGIGRFFQFDSVGIVNNSSNAPVFQNSGFINFTGSSTAGNAAITNNGLLEFNDTSTAGSATITNNNAIDFVNTSTAGNATITTNGSSSLIFFDTTTAGNATITLNRTSSMEFRGSSTAGNATITNDGSLVFRSTSTAGSATITNNGIVNFNDASTAGNASITNSAIGIAQFNNTSTAGNATITNNFALEFVDASTAGNAAITNNSLVVFRNTSTAGSATVVNDNLLNFIENGTAGNATITTANGGATRFFDSASGGAARMIANAGGQVDISGLVTAGTSFGSIEGAGLFTLGGKSLTVGSNNFSTTVSGIIDGIGGALTKLGTGTLTLTGVNTYTGATTVNDGTLSVNGSIASSSLTTVNAGGTLGGNGIVGNTTINGGTLASGNSVGTLTVQGSLVMTTAASYLVEVSPANADRVNVTGTATLGGATVKASFATGTLVASQYTILNATGGVNGTFNSLVNTNLPPGFLTTLSYDANNVFLNLTLGFGQAFALNDNQRNVANALTNFFNATGNVPLAFGALTPAGLTQASGEAATGSQQATFDVMTQFLGVLTDPFVTGRGGTAASPSAGASQFAEEGDAANGKPRSKDAGDAYAMIAKAAPSAPLLDQRWSVWAAGFGGSQTTDGNAATGSNTAASRVYGMAAGADYRFAPSTLAGFALAGAGTRFNVAGGLGHGASDVIQAGAFIRHTVGPAYLSGALAYGWQDVTTDRTVTIAGADQLRARFQVNALSGRAEAGYRFATPWMGITPYVAGQFTSLWLPAYAEQVLSGVNTFALNYASKVVTVPRSELGLRGDKSFALQSAILTLRGRAAWAHNFNTERSIAATFQTLPGASFVVSGAAPARDAALTTASAELMWSNGVSLAATFEGEFSNVTRSYAGKGVARYQW